MSLNSAREGKRPSQIELQNFIRNKQMLSFLLVDGGTREGVLKWFDEKAFCIELSDGNSFTLLKGNVIGYGPIEALDP